MAQVWSQYKLLLPYGASFAALWPSTNKQSAVQKSVSVFWGWGVCVKVSPRTACCCQKNKRASNEWNLLPLLLSLTFSKGESGNLLSGWSPNLDLVNKFYFAFQMS